MRRAVTRLRVRRRSGRIATVAWSRRRARSRFGATIGAHRGRTLMLGIIVVRGGGGRWSLVVLVMPVSWWRWTRFVVLVVVFSWIAASRWRVRLPRWRQRGRCVVVRSGCCCCCCTWQRRRHRVIATAMRWRNWSSIVVVCRCRDSIPVSSRRRSGICPTTTTATTVVIGCTWTWSCAIVCFRVVFTVVVWVLAD